MPPCTVCVWLVSGCVVHAAVWIIGGELCWCSRDGERALLLAVATGCMLDRSGCQSGGGGHVWRLVTERPAEGMHVVSVALGSDWCW